MAKELFRDQDIARWETVNSVVTANTTKYTDNQINLTNNTDIYLPCLLFTYMVRGKYSNFLPFKVTVNYMSEQYTYWTKDTNYLGVTHDDGSCILYLKKGNHSVVSLLWVLLHEFRHSIQFKNSCIMSNIDNSNLYLLTKLLLDSGYPQDLLDHVLHEIHPAEIDANIFACEKLGIPYPGSKFQVTEETIGMLKRKML